jgi:hypothetical protein
MTLGDGMVMHLESVDFIEPDVRDETPIPVQQRLAQLNGAMVKELPSHSLTIAVRDYSRFSPGWTYGRIEYPLFQALRTSRDRDARVYQCRQKGCPAKLHFSISGGKVRFLKADHMHNHLVALTSVVRANALTAEQRSAIIELTRMGLSVGKIRKRVCPDVDPHAIYDTRRHLLREAKENQAQRLVEAIKDWDDMTSLVVYDEDGTFTDCYFFHTRLTKITLVPFLETWVMDDTACTNWLGLPFVPIIGIDERNCDQLIAFALLRDRTEDSFKGFLDWVVEQLPPPANEGDAVPKGVIVDRGAGQMAGLKSSLRNTGIVICAKHLGANVSATFHGSPYQGELMDQFWSMVKRLGPVAEWQAFLAEIHTDDTLTEKQRKMLEWLHNNCQHYCGILTRQFGTDYASSRGEGYFGVHKIDTQHKPGSLLDVVDTAHQYAGKWRTDLLKPQTRRKPILDCLYLSADAQLHIGPNILKLIEDQIKKKLSSARSTPPDPNAVADHVCCPFAARYKLPCVHMILLHGTADPRLELSDFPARWLLPPRPEGAPPAVTHLTRERPVETPKKWTYQFCLAISESIFNACSRSADARRLVLEMTDAWAHIEPAPPRDGDAPDSIRDPVHRRVGGTPFRTPAGNSILSLTAPPPQEVAECTQIAKRRVACGICGRYGHNRRTCPNRSHPPLNDG